MLGMSVSGKTAIGQVVSGVRLIHDKKKVKRMLEAQKREINPDASEELYYFLNAEKRIVNVRFTQKVSGCGSWRKQQYEIIQYRRSGGHGRRDDAKCR